MKWKKVCLRDYTTKIGSGITPKGGASVYQERGFALFRSQNIYNGSFFDKGLAFINEVIAKKMQSVEVIEGDVLLNITGDSVARCCNAPSDFLPGRVNQHVAIIRANKEKLHSKFLMYQLISPFMQNTMLSYAEGAGATRNALTKSIIEDLRINLPPLRTQHLIASTLSAYDDLIENNLKRIKVLEEKAEVSFKLVLQEEKMNFYLLGQLATINEKSITEDFKFDDVLYVDISSVSPGNINEKFFFARSIAPGRARRMVKHQDIIWSCVRPNRKSYALIWNPEENLIVSTGFVVITSKNCSPLFLYQSLKTEQFVRYLENNATGAAYPAVTSKDFKVAPIEVPERTIQDKYQLEMEPIFELINNLKLQNRNLRDARDILLPRLMNGEIEV
jgi:type I restriction enzyme, S subunit